MGILSNLLGGKKAPAPPPQLGQSAQAVFNLAGGAAGRLPMLTTETNNFLPALRQTARQAGARYGAAARRAGKTGRDYATLFDTGGYDVLRTAQNEALEAGNLAKRTEAAARARETQQIALGNSLNTHAAMLARRGITGGGALNSPHLAALAAAQTGAAENLARRQEEERGIALRQAFMPVAAGFGQNAITLPAQAGQYRTAQQMALGSPALQMGQLLGNEQALASGAAQLHSRASDLFSTQYNAQLAKAQADQSRKAGIFGTLGTIAAVAAAPFTGGASLAALPAMGALGGGNSGSLGGAATNMPIPNAGGSPVLFPT